MQPVRHRLHVSDVCRYKVSSCVLCEWFGTSACAHNRLLASSGPQLGRAGYVPRQTEGLLMLIFAVMGYVALILI
jgi:hypothetical protein